MQVSNILYPITIIYFITVTITEQVHFLSNLLHLQATMKFKSLSFWSFAINSQEQQTIIAMHRIVEVLDV